MASVGPNDPDTAAGGGGGGVGWGTASNAVTSNDTYATANLGVNSISQYLKTTDYDFAIPTDAEITGIVVDIERKASNLLGKDNSVRLYKAGTLTGSDKATASAWPTTDTVATYGTSADLWGSTWTAADVNDSTFGVGLSVARNGGAPVMSVDVIQVTVHYLTELLLSVPAAAVTASAPAPFPVGYPTLTPAAVSVSASAVGVQSEGSASVLAPAAMVTASGPAPTLALSSSATVVVDAATAAVSGPSPVPSVIPSVPVAAVAVSAGTGSPSTPVRGRVSTSDGAIWRVFTDDMEGPDA